MPEAKAEHGAAKRRKPALFALSVRLARRGPLAVFALVLAAVITFGGVALAFAVARRPGGGGAALADVPAFVASLLGWGAGVMLAFAASTHALRRDRDEGIRALVRARGATSRAYLWGRIGGLVVVIAIAVVGGTLLTAIASTALATRASLVAVAQGSAASLVYAAAFSAMLGPVALAALGARSRAGGYMWLLGVLIVPELFEGWTSQILPEGWRDLGSIPGALAALRGALMPPGVDAAKIGRSAVVVAAVIALALLVVHRQLARVEAEEAL
jgi:hypothetical protein